MVILYKDTSLVIKPPPNRVGGGFIVCGIIISFVRTYFQKKVDG